MEGLAGAKSGLARARAEQTGLMHRSTEALEAGLDAVVAAPADAGELAMIVRRPAAEQREVLDEARLDAAEGLVGDDWSARGSRHTDDGQAEVDRQITLMSARAAELVAGSRERWPLAGDQLYVDFDLSEDNAPAGTRLSIGEALVEVTAPPHNGCAKFARRFGRDAVRFVNSPVGKALHLRGVNARVVEAGRVRSGDAVVKR